MSGLRDGWYIAEPDGEAIGPISRSELAQRAARGAFTAEALAWHVDIAEWQPLQKVAAATSGASGDANPHATPLENRNYEPARERQAEAPQSRRERKQARREAIARSAVVDDGKRLLSSAARGGKPPAAPHEHARSELFPPKGAKPNAAEAAKAEAAKNAALAGLGVRRFIARMIDTFTLGMAGSAAIWGWYLKTFALPRGDVPAEPPSVLLLLFLAVVALIPLEALALAIAGTTPGKALLGLRVTRAGAKPSFGAAFGRAVGVAWRGMGLGIPLFAVLTAVVGFVRLMNKGVSSWDEKSGLRAEGANVAGGRWQAALVALVGAFALLNSDFWPDLAWRIAGLR